MKGGKFCEELILNSSIPGVSAKSANLVCTEMCSCNINEDCENRNHKILYECVEEEN